MTREEMIANLRMMANFIEARPELDSYFGDLSIHYRCKTVKDIRTFIQSVGGTYKNASGESFWCSHKFGNGSYSEIDIWASIERDKICRRITKKIIKPAQPALPEREVEETEWDCSEAILAGE